jgi:hypothetical protein
LELLDVEDREEVACLTLKNVIPEIDIDVQSKYKFDVQNLTPEAAIYWRLLCNHINDLKVLSL